MSDPQPLQSLSISILDDNSPGNIDTPIKNQISEKFQLQQSIQTVKESDEYETIINEEKKQKLYRRKVFAFSILIIIVVVLAIISYLKFFYEPSEPDNQEDKKTEIKNLTASNLSLNKLNNTVWLAQDSIAINPYRGWIKFKKKIAVFNLIINQSCTIVFNLKVSNDKLLFFYNDEKTDWGAGPTKADIAYHNSPEPNSLFAEATIKENELHIIYLNKGFVNAVNSDPGKIDNYKLSPPFSEIFYMEWEGD